MSPIIIGVLALLGFALIGGLVYVGLREDDGNDPLQQRLAEIGDREAPQSLEELEMSLSFRDRIVLPFLRWVANITSALTPEKQIEATRKRLEMAGMAGDVDPSVFFAGRIVFALVMPFIAFMVFFVNSTGFFGPVMSTIILIASAPFGYFLLPLWLGSKISKRQDEIVKALPDALDLLTICVEAGLGFDAAMGKVYEKWDNDLALAFGRVLREIQLGKGRREALKDMSDRLEVPDVTTFIAAVIQADSLGVSMAQILRVQSDQMRVKRRQRAQEKAQQAPVKMLIPMVFLIFPSIWIVLLGPAMIQVMDSGALEVF